MADPKHMHAARPGSAASPVLFLDFDGVLHPTGDRAVGDSFCKLPMLEAMLREPPFVQVKIVISSTWREVYVLARLRRLFSADIGKRIIGITPSLEDYDGLHPRYWEIKAWLALHPEVEQHAALDDMAGWFPSDWHPHAVFTDGEEGLTEADVEALRRLLAPRESRAGPWVA